MRLCGICKTPPRMDDSLTLVQVNAADSGAGVALVVSATGHFEGTRSASACRTCAATINGFPPPPDPTYPPGCAMPPKLEICGLCRRALREGEGVRSMRLAPEDLNESLWQAYDAEIHNARMALRDAAIPAIEAFKQATAPHQAKRTAELARLAAEAEKMQDEIILTATSQEEADSMLAEWQQRHDEETRYVEAEYTAVTAVAKLAMDTALSRAEFPYRKAAIEAYRKVEPLHRGGSLSAEPGLYASCSECLTTYRPRIAERLKRQGVIKPGVLNETVSGDMLM